MSNEDSNKVPCSKAALHSLKESKESSKQEQNSTSADKIASVDVLQQQVEKIIPADSKLKTLGSPGPFQVIDGPIISKSTQPELDHPPEGPRRRYDCKNYEICLDLAAALNWDSFTCRGCCGDTNEKLLWRAQHEVRKDQMAQVICDLPDPRERKIEATGNTAGLKLVLGKS